MKPIYPIRAVNETGDTTIDVQLIQVPDSAITAGSGVVSLATATGDVTGPSSAVNNNLAAFDTTTGKLLEDSGIATSQVATSQTAATQVARLALTGLARGARVYQTDNGFWYELTNAAAPSDAASWQGIPKKYVANLTQTGTDAPVATVLENSLGGTVVWTYSDVGIYIGTLSAAFTADKTAAFIGGVDTVDTAGAARIIWTSVNTVNIISFDTTTGSKQNDQLVTTPVEISVYP